MSDKNDAPCQEESASTSQFPFEVIEPKKTLKRAIVPGSPPGFDFEAIENAEKVMEELSENYVEWMADSVARINSSLVEMKVKGPTEETISAIYRTAHDLRGDGVLFGFDLAGDAANSLCIYLDAVRITRRPSIYIVERYVDAIIAMSRPTKAGMSHQVTEILVEALRVLASDHTAKAEKIRKAAA